MVRQSPQVPESAILSVRLDRAQKEQLDRLAKASDRSVSWLVQDALAAYLEAQQWQVQAIDDAVKAADAAPDQGVSHERARAWVESWGTKREKRRPR